MLPSCHSSKRCFLSSAECRGAISFDSPRSSADALVAPAASLLRSSQSASALIVRHDHERARAPPRRRSPRAPSACTAHTTRLDDLGGVPSYRRCGCPRLCPAHEQRVRSAGRTSAFHRPRGTARGRVRELFARSRSERVRATAGRRRSSAYSSNLAEHLVRLRQRGVCGRRSRGSAARIAKRREQARAEVLAQLLRDALSSARAHAARRSRLHAACHDRRAVKSLTSQRVEARRTGGTPRKASATAPPRP